MKPTASELEAILRERICGVCTDRTVEGDCGREDPSECALFRMLPQVVDTIQSVDSKDIRDYVGALRTGVCNVCAQQAADGSCKEREQVKCALDAYLLLIVDVIEEATGRTFERSKLTGAVPLHRAT
jgi:hypothetical protein